MMSSIKDFISETERDDINELAEKLKAEKKQEIKLLESISHHATYGDADKLSNAVSAFANKAEADFLEGKKLSLLVREGRMVSDRDFRYMGTTEQFPCDLSYSSEDRCWVFLLPPLPSVGTGRFNKEAGRHTGYLLKNLIRRYRETYGEIPELTSPVVVFEHGIRNIDTFSRLFDADNRDTKKAMDALTGTFFPDDNVLAVTTMHLGCKADKDYTRIYVLEAGQLPRFLQKKYPEFRA